LLSWPSLLSTCGLFSPLLLNHFLCRFWLGYSLRWLIISSFGDLFGVVVRSSFWITISSIWYFQPLFIIRDLWCVSYSKVVLDALYTYATWFWDILYCSFLSFVAWPPFWSLVCVLFLDYTLFLGVGGWSVWHHNLDFWIVTKGLSIWHWDIFQDTRTILSPIPPVIIPWEEHILYCIFKVE